MQEKIGFRLITGIIKNIKTVFSKKTKFPEKFPEAVLEDFARASSRENKIRALESELKKAQALAEAQRKHARLLK